MSFRGGLEKICNEWESKGHMVKRLGQFKYAGRASQEGMRRRNEEIAIKIGEEMEEEEGMMCLINQEVDEEQEDLRIYFEEEAKKS
jgi:hypothetical protein